MATKNVQTVAVENAASEAPAANVPQAQDSVDVLDLSTVLASLPLDAQAKVRTVLDAQVAKAQRAAQRDVAPVFQTRPMPAWMLAQVERNMAAQRGTDKRTETRRDAEALTTDAPRMSDTVAQLGVWLSAQPKTTGKVLNARAAHSLMLAALDAAKNAGTETAMREALQVCREKFATLLIAMPAVPAMNGTKATNEERTALATLRTLARTALSLPVTTLSNEDRAVIDGEERNRADARALRLATSGRNVPTSQVFITGPVVEQGN